MKPEARDAARNAVLGAVEGLGAGQRQDPSLARLLEAVGRLELVEPGVATTLVPPEVSDRVRKALGAPLGADALSSVGLEVLGAEILAALDDRDDDDALPDETQGPSPLAALERALDARDRVELALLGAEVLGPGDPTLDEELRAELDAFEEILRPELWRLTVTNDHRARPLAFVPPTYRDRFWWRFDGIDLDPRAVDALPAVASLVSRYPEARDQLERLVDADHAWHRNEPWVESTTPEPARDRGVETGGDVVSLAGWVARRARATPGVEVVRRSEGDGEDEPLALAAAPPDAELPLLELPEVELSFRAPRELLVDVLADRDPSRPPSLRRLDGRIDDLAPVPNALERFSIQLDEPLLDETGVVLRIPLAAGTLEIRLPPEGE